ncbi:MAG TPA: helix-turn-helix domain-containing protein [Bacillota bacterium]|nr:helix-turn-helix domain-containing protein [Bacillota bacterium]
MENNVIMLNEEQRSELEMFAKNGTHNAHLITRAKTVLALDRSNKKDHLRISRVIEQVELSRQAIYDIRDAFLEAPDVSTFLTRKKRETPPVPAKITGDVEAHIIALACSEPPKGFARWTVRLLAEKSVELKFVDSLSHMTVDRLLKKRNISLT